MNQSDAVSLSLHQRAAIFLAGQKRCIPLTNFALSAIAKKSRRIQNKPNATRLFYRHSTFSLFHHFLSAHRHKQEEDREDTGGEEADEAARPAEVVNDEAHVDARERGADDVAHESRKTGCAPPLQHAAPCPPPADRSS